MNFDTTEEQQLLADSVRRLLQKDHDWGSLAGLGVLALPLPAEHGGFGGGAIDLMGVMEALGEAISREPVLEGLVAARLVARAGSDAQRDRLLPAFGEGRLRLAFAQAREGRCAAVVGALAADFVVVADGSKLFLLERSKIELTTYKTLDEHEAADFGFSREKAEPLGAGAGELVDEALDFAAALACADAVGAMKFACDATLEFLKTRKQFGVPIGTFQALQHRMVDMFISLEQARSMACLACSKVDQAPDAGERPLAVSAAKIRVGDAARHVSQESVQLHGGMGMSEEMKVSHAFRRLTMAARRYGDVDFHLARFASLS